MWRGALAACGAIGLTLCARFATAPSAGLAARAVHIAAVGSSTAIVPNSIASTFPEHR